MKYQNSKYSILIKGMDSPESFVEEWSKSYRSIELEENKYLENIHNVFDSRDKFRLLFEWKNGTKSKIASKKEEVIEQYWQLVANADLVNNFSLIEFEAKFQPSKSATIWKIFLLHLIRPLEYPIFDQHVYRAYKFISTGTIEEFPASYSKIYSLYKDEYIDWFKSFQSLTKCEAKKIDEALFAFGQMLKQVRKYPYKITTI